MTMQFILYTQMINGIGSYIFLDLAKQ